MPRHEDMDYHHTRWHCDDCWDAYVQEKRHGEMIEALHSTVIERKTEYRFTPRAYEKNKEEDKKKGGAINLDATEL